MSTMILACSSLQDYINAAQEKLGTDYRVVYMDKKYHAEPKAMHGHIVSYLSAVPQGIDTILVFMGYCGGSWEGVTVPCRIVLPRLDDCVSLLLQTDDSYCPDRKQMGHLYMKDKDPKNFSLLQAFEGWTANMTPEEKEKTRQLWTSAYSSIDIVDTGMYDCHSEAYIAEAKKNAEWIGGTVQYVDGSSRIIEKSLSGNWDEQFFVAEKGYTITRKNLL